jgi:exopolysaccharide production protein ExoZ
LVKLNEPLTLPLQVAWTLFYELTFYGVFMIAILNRTAGIVVLCGWVIAILWNSLAVGDTRMGPLHMWNVYFLCGAAIFFLSRHADGRWGLPALVSGIVLLVVLASDGMSDRINDVQVNAPMLLALVAPFALIMLGAVLAERTYGFQPHQALMLLGAASYSIYLVHSPAISVIAILNSKFFPGVLPPPLLFMATVSLSVVAGVIVHLFIEKPMLERLRRPVIGKPEAAR